MDTYFPKPRFACFEKMVIHGVEFNGMKYIQLFMVIYLTTIFTGCANQVQHNNPSTIGSSIDIFDKTTEWTYPYSAPEVKSNRIRSAIDSITNGMAYSNVLCALGTPDVINDLRQPFFGLSPSEDGFLVRYRSAVTYRLLYYLSKNGESANINDKWISVYLSRDGENVFTKLKNNI